MVMTGQGSEGLYVAVSVVVRAFNVTAEWLKDGWEKESWPDWLWRAHQFEDLEDGSSRSPTFERNRLNPTEHEWVVRRPDGWVRVKAGDWLVWFGEVGQGLADIRVFDEDTFSLLFRLR